MRTVFRRADPKGVLMAFVDSQPAVVLSAVLDRLHGYRIGLDGVPEREPSCRQSGFELAWRNVRYAGIPGLEAPADPRLVSVGLELIPTLMDYDRAFFPAPRAEFMRCWLAGGPTRRSWAFVENGAVAGYGTVRQCRNGSKIGPLFADDASTAGLLFRATGERRRAAARPHLRHYDVRTRLSTGRVAA